MVKTTAALWILLATAGAAAAGSRPFQPRAASPLDTASSTRNNALTTALALPRGGVDATTEKVVTSNKQAGNLVVSALKGLRSSMAGSKADTLLLLTSTAFNTPVCQRLGVSPILGFLALGILLGPNNGRALVQNVHTTELLADIGIVFFLFEMGLHLSLKKLKQMRTTVFGLGGSQFVVTALVVAAVALALGQSPAAATILGGGLALSSSAFVLQLLKDKKELKSEFGQSSFGVLLLQDLMVVPLLVITPILAPATKGAPPKNIGRAIQAALVQLSLALAAIAGMGQYLLTPLFDSVVKAKSQEALVGLIMLTVLGMSFLTEGLGLSNTLGPFLAGVLLAENKHLHRIETETNPIRGILVGLFFVTVGFEIDLALIAKEWKLVSSLVASLLVVKTIIAAGVGRAFGMDGPTSRRLGLVLSQGGEFAFVAFRTAKSFNILDEKLTQILLTVVALSMAFTPLLEDLGEELQLKAHALDVPPPPLNPDSKLWKDD